MFNLTSSEKKTLLFVSIILIASGFYQLFQPHKSINQSVDYSKSDSIFNRLSKINILSAQENPTNQSDTSFTKDRPEAQVTTKKKYKKSTKNVLLPESININTAPEAELQKLPRIGPTMASRIINYRKKYGNFNSKDDLLKVKGIGKKTLEKLSPYITLD